MYVLALYVDDLIICGVMKAIGDVKRHLPSRYKMKTEYSSSDPRV